MYQRIVVPVDGSELSWRSMAPAQALAERWDAPVRAVSVVGTTAAAEFTHDEIDALLAAAGWRSRTTVQVVVDAQRSVGEIVGDVAEEMPGSLVVMSSHGRGRSAALLGSVAEDVLRATTGPALLLGPRVTSDRVGFDGPIVYAVDGTSISESALGAAGAWAAGLHLTPWVVTTTGSGGASGDVADTAYPHRLADEMAKITGATVEYETVHGDPAEAIVGFADDLGAALVVAATHAPDGLRRIVTGSTAMAIVHRAHCPVLVLRAPDFVAEPR